MIGYGNELKLMIPKGRGRSSVGRAPIWHVGGHGFKSRRLHHLKRMVELLSPAKVNFGLWVIGKRFDGYHNIVTILRKISIYDVIYIEEGPFRVETSTGIPPERNLVYKALLEFSIRTGIEIPFSIYIEKNIPEGAGLGGGSSNLAITLKAVNELLENPLGEEELKDIALSFSSDAPFFMKEGSAVGKGRGDELEYIKLPDMDLTVIYPGVSSSTVRVYSCLRDFMLTAESEVDIIVKKIKSGEFEVMSNILGDLACELYPEVGEVKRFVEYFGIKSYISGAGSSVFYIGEPLPEIEKGAKLRNWKIFSVRTLDGV